jgi:hypothetical protein
MMSPNEAVMLAVQIDAPNCAPPRSGSLLKFRPKTFRRLTSLAIDRVTRSDRQLIAAQGGLAATAFQRDHEAPMTGVR